MSLFNVFNVSGSGMSAQSIRLNTVSSNMANANSASSSTDQLYKARQPVFETMLQQAGGMGESAGVRVTDIVESQAPARREYAPHHPKSDKDGYVFYPNVNMVEEMANMISASRSFQSNVEVMDTAKNLILRTLTLGQ